MSADDDATGLESGSVERQRLINALVASDLTLDDRGVWAALETRELRANLTRVRHLERAAATGDRWTDLESDADTGGDA